MSAKADELFQIQKELTALVDQAIGGRLIRYTLVVAIPEGDGLLNAATGNAGVRLTELMLRDALVKTIAFPELRRDGRPEERLPDQPEAKPTK